MKNIHYGRQLNPEKKTPSLDLDEIIYMVLLILVVAFYLYTEIV